jgi:hypothetical protein
VLISGQKEHLLNLWVFNPPFFGINFHLHIFTHKFLSDIFVYSLILKLTPNMLLLVHNGGDHKIVVVGFSGDELWVDEGMELNLILVWKLQVMGHFGEQFGYGLKVLVLDGKSGLVFG